MTPPPRERSPHAGGQDTCLWAWNRRFNGIVFYQFLPFARSSRGSNSRHPRTARCRVGTTATPSPGDRRANDQHRWWAEARHYRARSHRGRALIPDRATAANGVVRSWYPALGRLWTRDGHKPMSRCFVPLGWALTLAGERPAPGRGRCTGDDHSRVRILQYTIVAGARRACGMCGRIYIPAGLIRDIVACGSTQTIAIVRSPPLHWARDGVCVAVVAGIGGACSPGGAATAGRALDRIQDFATAPAYMRFEGTTTMLRMNGRGSGPRHDEIPGRARHDRLDLTSGLPSPRLGGDHSVLASADGPRVAMGRPARSRPARARRSPGRCSPRVVTRSGARGDAVPRPANRSRCPRAATHSLHMSSSGTRSTKCDFSHRISPGDGGNCLRHSRGIRAKAPSTDPATESPPSQLPRDMAQTVASHPRAKCAARSHFVAARSGRRHRERIVAARCAAATPFAAVGTAWPRAPERVTTQPAPHRSGTACTRQDRDRAGRPMPTSSVRSQN